MTRNERRNVGLAVIVVLLASYGLAEAGRNDTASAQRAWCEQAGGEVLKSDAGFTMCLMHARMPAARVVPRVAPALPETQA